MTYFGEKIEKNKNNYLLLLYRESKGRLDDFEGKYFTKGTRDLFGS